MTEFVQCTLRKGDRVRERWIPREVARIGKFIKFKEKCEWVFDWQVVMLGAIREIEESPIIEESFRSRMLKKIKKLFK